MDEKHWCEAKYHSSRCSGGFWCHVKFRKFIVISPACKSRPTSVFSCHFAGHPQFWTWGIPKTFTSTSSVDMSINREIVAHWNKQRPDNVIITSVCLVFFFFFVLLRSINMWKPPVPVNLFDLRPLLYVSQTTNSCSCDGGLPVGSHPQTPVQIDWDVSARRQQWVSKKKWLL